MCLSRWLLELVTINSNSLATMTSLYVFPLSPGWAPTIQPPMPLGSDTVPAAING